VKKYTRFTKSVALLLAALLTLTAAGCGGNSGAAETPVSDDAVQAGADAEKLSIVATIFPPYDFSREIAGGLAEITMLLPPASESHSFEPTAQDIIKIQNCDAFIYVGGESDEWVNGVLDSMDTSNIKIITLMDCVEVVEEEIVEGMQDEEEAEEGEEGEEAEEGPEYDEHVWTSPRNAKLIVAKLTDAFCEADSANAEAYRANAEAYSAELDALDAEFRAVTDNAARRVIVFGDRFPFRYFADAYDLDYFAAFPGCSTETEASMATVAFLIDKIKEENIPVIFHIELSNGKMADTIAGETGAEKRLLHAAHNISKADFEAGESYLSIMSRNVDSLQAALQ
jgi:zinc transport system substrate-binding protein